MEEPLPGAVGDLPRLSDDKLQDRINRLFAIFPNPETKRPYTNAEAAAAITAAGVSINANTIGNARRGETNPSQKHLAGLADLFGADPGYLFPGTVADTQARQAQESGTLSPTELAAIAKFFKAPAAYLADTRLGEDLDAELQVLTAMQDADIRSFALRYQGTLNAEKKRAMAMTLRDAGRRHRRRVMPPRKGEAPDGPPDRQG